jgi:hypothetical protein
MAEFTEYNSWQSSTAECTEYNELQQNWNIIYNHQKVSKSTQANGDGCTFRNPQHSEFLDKPKTNLCSSTDFATVLHCNVLKNTTEATYYLHMLNHFRECRRPRSLYPDILKELGEGDISVTVTKPACQ